ncbi:MAG: hypothetical protein OEM29_08550 [Thermoplasmata archaeon]|nr:hypothetical protein [Thermoplasmata archaeon]
MAVRDISAVTLCLAIVVCLSLTSVASEASLENDVNSGWGTATLIETNNSGSAAPPQVAVDGSGNATAVWVQNDGIRKNIWSSRYVVGTGWGIATLIETGSSERSQSPQIAVDDSGNATAVWVQYDGIRNNICSNRYVVGTGWGIATLIETNNSGFAYNPQVAVDGLGDAIAVWFQYDGTGSTIWSNRYVVGTGWGIATLIETDDTGDASYPQVAVDGSGNATAVWVQNDGIRNNIWSNRYVVGTGWEIATLVETNNSGSAASPQIAVDTSGNATAVWVQNDGIRNSIWSNRYVVGTGWGIATLIETNNSGGATSSQVAVDDSGNAIAVWRQYDNTGSNIWSNRYVVGTGWGIATLIETGSGSAGSPQVAVDGSGNAIAVWYQSDGTRYNIWSNRYVIGTGWGIATLIETDDTGDASYPRVAIDASGNAIAVWSQCNDTGDYNIWSNRYAEQDTTPSSLTSTIAVFVILAVVASIIIFSFFWLRKKTADRSSKTIEDEEPPPLS